MLNYCFCGHTVQSEIELPELIRTNSDTPAHIHINVAELSEGDVTHPIIVKPFSRFNAQEFFFELPDVIRMLVRNGTEILVEFLTADTNFALQSVYQNAIPIAMLQRRIIPFRASGVVDINGFVWLFFAPPRSGMTSNALFLMERGYQFFSDTMVAMRLENGTIFAAPFSPTMHIWKPVLDQQSIFEPDEVRPIRESIPKFVASLNPDQFDQSERQVQGLIQVEHIANSISHQPIKMVDAFETLRNAIYHNHLTAHLGIESTIFAMLSIIVKQTELIRVTRPKNKDSYHELAEYIDTKIINGDRRNDA